MIQARNPEAWCQLPVPSSPISIENDIAITMGNVYLIDATGKETVVDKLWVFKRDDDGRLRIIAHKSAIPNPVPAKN